MKRYILYIVMLVVLANLVFAERTPLDYDDLQLRTEVWGGINIISTGTDYYVNTAEVNLTWVPDVTYRQEIIHMATDPKANIDETINFLWENPRSGEKDFEVVIGTKNYNKFRRVFEKVDFPLENIEGEYYIYLVPSEVSDITPEIRELGTSLVEDEDDLYAAVFKLAVWVYENIDYDLSTITAEASQTSSWVLENRRGVCDELTSLFMSMGRAVGIPMKFVSGIAYTNTGNNPNQWGPHGWAEVYFPGTGWVPFDVTYKQLGYLDATHIKLDESIDAYGTSMRFSANGKDINIESDGLNTETRVINQGSLLRPVISMKADMHKNIVGFGSYNMLTVTVKNKVNHYVPVLLKIGKPDEISVIGSEEISLLLEPFQEKKAHYIIKVSNSLRDNYKYTFPLAIQERRKGSVETSFQADANTGIYELDYFESMISSEEAEQKRPYSINVRLNCTPHKSNIYLEDVLEVRCVAHNNGNIILPYSSICFNNECHNEQIAALGNISANFTKTFDSIGVKNLAFIAGSLDFLKTTYVLINVMDRPLLSIFNLTYPSNISYDELGTISFTLRKDSVYAPKKATITVKHGLFEKEWAVEDIQKSTKFQLEFFGKNLKLRNNDFEIIVDYEDFQGETYSTKKKFSIDVKTIGLWQKFLLLLNSWETRLENMFR